LETLSTNNHSDRFCDVKRVDLSQPKPFIIKDINWRFAFPELSICAICVKTLVMMKKFGSGPPLYLFRRFV
jgi:hypothetical protein